MSPLRHCFVLFAVLGTLVFVAAPAIADWNEGDGHKMHYPQLPNPYGWDVSWSDTWLGDDWKCSQSGPVSDIHLWLSFKNYSQTIVPPAMAATPIQVQIWANNPGGTQGFSYPDHLLWDRQFQPAPTGGNPPNAYTIRHYGCGSQGWLWPSGDYILDDHTQFFQINIDGILDPWYQQKDAIYWLVVKVPPISPQAGWKTSMSPHFMDDAVRGTGITMITWSPIEDPITGESLDLAFVITPEPGTLALLVMAGLGVGLFAWRRRR